VQTEGLAVRAQARCPFLEGVVSTDDADSQAPEGAAPECAAIGSPIGLAPRQVALACLSDDHVVCPRYLRGAGLITLERSRPGLDRLGSLRRPVVAAVLVLLLSAGVTVGYLVAGRGLNLPGSSTLLVAAASPSKSPAARSAPSPSPEPSPSPSLETSVGLSASPSPTASPSPGEPPAGAVEALFPQGGLWDHLTPCSGVSDCYVYTVQSNDTLAAIGETFHVPMKTILTRNPQISNPRLLHAGQKITLPTPTP
jgi:hypothetical protein